MNKMVLMAITACGIAIAGCDPATPESEHACVEIDISELYSDPLTYNGLIVCTEGLLRVGPDFIAIHPADLASDGLHGVRLRPPITAHDVLRHELTTGDQVRVYGRLMFDEYCVSIRTPEFEDDEPSFCAPVALPATFEDGGYTVISRDSY